MANDIELKLEVVNSTIAEAKSTIAGNQSGIDSEYSALISQFAESSGETADALRSLQKAEQEAAKIADHLNLVGTLAVEMFVLEDGGIVINELAPRPHNSGHYSIEACNVSQFTQHIRAVCGWPLRKPKLWAPAIMVNVLGQHVVPLTNSISKYPDWSVHLYGKAEAKVA